MSHSASEKNAKFYLYRSKQRIFGTNFVSLQPGKCLTYKYKIDMISEKLQKAINDQVKAEMWSANLYLAMSFYFKRNSYDGFANWMKKQSDEEMDHAMQLADYVMKRGGVITVDAIDAVDNEWKSPLEVFERVYAHECHVSQLIDALVDVASSERDKASQDFLWGFVREQVEEEATAQGIVDKIKNAGEAQAAIFMLDAQLGARK